MQSPTPVQESPPSDGVPVPQRYWAAATILLGLALAVLDGAIANVALPTIAQDVHASAADSIWVVNAYQLAVTISLLPLASLGEIVGYRVVYRLGLVVFTLASLGCALSGSLATLTLARTIQGFGAAGIMSVNGALVRFIYPRRMMGQGFGINATVGSISSAVGPTVAAAILSVANWPWLFAVNLPIGAAAIVFAWKALPATPKLRQPFDVSSALLSAVVFGTLITGIDGLGHGERALAVVVQLLVAVAIGAVLVTRQLTRPAPLLPVDLMRIPLFALSVATSVCSFMAQGMALVSLPFLFEATLGFNEVTTGLLMTPWPLTVAMIAPFSGRLADRYPVGVLSGCGLAVMAAGLGLLAWMPAHPAPLDIVWRMAVCGVGFGFFNTPNNRAILTTAPRARSGGASGMQALARLFGQTNGAAVVALVFGLAGARGSLTTLLIATILAAAAALVSFSRLAGGGQAPRTRG
ncbi:MAG TPA: MFS transporter [Acetobacteraceae bacterium]|nr:MFS transporter [Acetobacteraceae bacterium]